MKAILFALALGLSARCALAVDGQVLINQSTVMAAGGFPYVISQPGSYKLSGNLLVPINQDGIHINASNVTLDLNGFCIFPAVYTPNVTAISSEETSNVVVKNGTLTGWGLAIVFAGSTRLITIEGINAQENYTSNAGGFTNGIAILIQNSNNLVRRITTDGQISIKCPSVILDTLSTVNTTGAGCVFTNTGRPDGAN